MSGVHSVLLVGTDGRLVANHHAVATNQVANLVEQLRAKHPGARVIVDGSDMSDSLATQPAPTRSSTVDVGVVAAVDGLSTAELANRMLWESFKRSCQVQSYMLDRMTGCAVDMNRRFVQELETMRGSYSKALERLDGIEFEKRMIEHEAASRRLGAFQVRLAEEDNRAAERRRDDNRSTFDHFARGVLRVFDMIGDPHNNKQ